MRRVAPLTLIIAIAACAPMPPVSLSPDATVQANRAIKSRATLIRVQTKSASQKMDLLAEGFDLFAIQGSSADAVVSPKQLEYLQAHKIAFKNLGPQSGLFGDGDRGLPSGYKTFDQVVAQLKQWQTSRPDVVTLRDVGDTWEKSTGKSPTHDIWALTIGNPKNAGKPAMLVLGGMHARELAPVELSMRLAQQLIDGYGKDPEITKQLDTRDVIIVPVVNVDGRKAVERGDSMWRKNTHSFPGGTGVDLNRNFDAHWDYKGVEIPAGWDKARWDSFTSQARDVDAEIYCGPSAASEPETQAVAGLFRQRKINLSVDLHAYGEMMIWPLGYTTTPTPHTGVFQNVWRKVAPNYRGGTSMQLLYPTCGTTKDFAYEKYKSISFTIEVGNQSDGFRPDYKRVDSIWNQLGPGLRYMVSIADNPVLGK